MISRIFFSLSFLTFLVSSLKSQTFTETFGTITSGGTLAITAQTFDNEPQYSYSGSADLRGTSTYPGINNSTNANVLYNAVEDIIISGFGTNSSCSSLDFAIRIFKTANAQDGSTFVLYYSTTDATGPWTTIGSPTLPTGSGTTNIYYDRTITLSTVPEGIAAIRLACTNCTSGTNYRLDNLVITGSGGDCVLPIELLNLNVKSYTSSTLLTFSTATEINNSHFVIERSADARTFSEIGRVQGAGTTRVPQSYTFTDEKPLSGLNYYRLRQVDFDGAESLSGVVSVVFGKAGSITIAPSPATDRVRIQLDEALTNDGLWQVFDNMGRQVLSGEWQAESADYDLDVNTLPEGMYTFRLAVGTQVQVKQFRKL